MVDARKGHVFNEIKKTFVFEAFKITLFCLVSTGLFFLIGVKTNLLLIIFNIAVMCCVATFSPEKKQLVHVLEGSIVILVSIIVAGILGFYIPTFAKLLTICYASLAFLIPKTQERTNIFKTGSIVFLIFSSLPFDLHSGFLLSLCGLALMPILMVFYWLFDKKIYLGKSHKKFNLAEARAISAFITCLALSGAWLISIILQHYTVINHLYWIGLTVLLVIQGSHQKTIKTSFIRIVVNTVGALMIILLTYIVPQDFWLNLTLLTLFLFLIFAYGYSYIVRTLFIELFVIWFTHLLGQYQNIIVINRIFLTLIGGVLVIIVTFIAYQGLYFIKKKTNG